MVRSFLRCTSPINGMQINYSKYALAFLGYFFSSFHIFLPVAGLVGVAPASQELAITLSAIIGFAFAFLSAALATYYLLVGSSSASAKLVLHIVVIFVSDMMGVFFGAVGAYETIQWKANIPGVVRLLFPSLWLGAIVTVPPVAIVEAVVLMRECCINDENRSESSSSDSLPLFTSYGTGNIPLRAI